MLTNGSLFTKEQISQLAKIKLTDIQFAMDGIACDYDRRRCYKNGNPSFNHIISNLKKILENTEISINIRVVIDKTNPNAYDELKLYLKEHFASFMEKKQLSIYCNYVKNRTGFDSEGVCYSLESIFQKGINYLKNEEENTLFKLFPKTSYSCMYRNISSFCIDSLGNIYKCMEEIGNEECRIGNILNGKISLQEIAKASFIEDPFTDENCLNCNVLPICAGGCPIDRIRRRKGTGVLNCSIYKNRVEQLIPYMYKDFINKKK